MKCQGVIPERTYEVGTELVDVRPAVFEDRDGEQIVVEPPVRQARVVTETTPEHPCEAEAGMLARSMRQETCNLGGAHWVKDGPDRAYCASCFRPGTATALDGTTSQHPAMAIEEYEG